MGCVKKNNALCCHWKGRTLLYRFFIIIRISFAEFWVDRCFLKLRITFFAFSFLEKKKPTGPIHLNPGFSELRILFREAEKRF
jgi:hypothetical protein